MSDVYAYIFVMAAVTYGIRALPLTLIRKEIKNRTVQSFLYYVPYVTLAVMTFPAILEATGSPLSGFIGFIAAVAAAYKGLPLLQTSFLACTLVLCAEFVLVSA